MNIVLDANLVASLVLPLPYSEATTVQFLAWKRQQITFIAPALWNYEVGAYPAQGGCNGLLACG